MKKDGLSDKKILGFLAIIVAAMIALAAVIALPLKCAFSKSDESLERIDNPDQGFYRPIYVELAESGAKYNPNIINGDTQLYHLRADISAFSKAVNGVSDKAIAASALDGLEELLALLRLKGKNAVVRFAYDPKYNGAKDKEPTTDIMLAHIGQICGVLNKFPATVTAVETGLLGPWGEMHSSKLATLQNKVMLAEKFLAETGESGLAVLVRTPDVIYGALGITVKGIDGFTVPENSPVRRLGLYNDGYLGSGNDLGTYTDREREIEFMERQNEFLPYGGEVVMPDSEYHDIDKCLPEMFKTGLSYLNIEWNDKVIAKWKKTYYSESCGKDRHYYGKTAFEYIRNRLGYRLVLKKSSLKISGGEVKVSLKIQNVGFGNLTKEKKVRLIFVSDSGEIVRADCGVYRGGNLQLSATRGLSGEYNVYLCLYGEEFDGAPNYAVRFANKDIWNGELKANYIGKLKIS